MIEIWLAFSIIFSISFLFWFVVVGSIGTDDFDRKMAKGLLLCSVLSWAWPVTLPTAAAYGLYKAIKNVFGKDEI